MSTSTPMYRFKRICAETPKAICLDDMWIPKSVILDREQIDDEDIRVWLKPWFAEKKYRKLKRHYVSPDSRAAYDHHNEDADHVYYAENPEYFGR